MNRVAKKLDDEAAEWVALMDSGHWSTSDEEALQRWLAVDALRHGLLLRAHATWMAVDHALASDQPVPEDIEELEVDDQAPGAGRWGRRAILGGVAAAGAAVFFGRMWQLGAETDYSTNLGEIRRVPLADGSVMTMNSSSSVAIRMERRARRVSLTQGEAWFDVAKNAARPFIVEAGPVRAKAIGTAFSVRMRDNGVEVLVTEGIVETWSDDVVGKPIRLGAGQRAIIGAGAARVEPEEASIDRALAWRGGIIDLSGETLGEAASEFNRYNERKVVVTDARMAAERMDGVFRINDPEGFADAVRVGFSASVRLDDPSVILIDR
ncbi:FecR family protein [Sphingomonas sp.]|uniref:FecR family protein n=1 Tax=Sphingomonas sp. TaxID=28214 RepID=UPI003D6CFC96